MLCFKILIIDYIGELKMSPEMANRLSVCLCPHPPLEASTFVSACEHRGSFMEYLD